MTRPKQKPMREQPCALRWSNTVVEALLFAREDGLSAADLVRITGLSLYQVETGFWLAGTRGELVFFKRAVKNGGTRFWATEFRAGYDQELAKNRRAYLRHNAERWRERRDRALEKRVNNNDFEREPVHRVVPMSACNVVKTGLASVWELAA